MDKDRFHVGFAPNSSNDGGTNIQVRTPSGRVVYDHLSDIDNAQRHCDYLNVAIEEVLGAFRPVMNAARLYYQAFKAYDYQLAEKTRMRMFEALEVLDNGE